MNVYFENLISDVKKYKLFFIGLAVALAVVGGGYGFISAKKASSLSEAEKQEISSYNEKLENYRMAVEDAKSALLEQEIIVRELREYNENSILMKINPQSVKYITIQYAINYADGVNAGNVNQSILAYIKDGGLKESVEDKEALETKYWGEVLSAEISGNILNITLSHYDTEKGKAVIKTVRKKLLEKVPEITAIQGEFSLIEQEMSVFEKSEVGLINIQSSNHDNLRYHLTQKEDMENRVTYLISELENFEKENRPIALDKGVKNPVKNAVVFSVLGVLAAICLFLVIEAALYLFVDRIRGEADVRECGLNTLGFVYGNRYEPLPERGEMDMKLILEKNRLDAIHFVQLGSTEKLGEVSGKYEALLSQDGITVSKCNAGTEDTECLKKLVEAGAGLLLVDAACVSKKKVKETVYDMEKFGVVVAGSVIVY